MNRSQAVLAAACRACPSGRRHDYVRNGIHSMFAAFNVADGHVISACHTAAPRIGVQDSSWLASTPRSRPTWMSTSICDNYGPTRSAINAWGRPTPASKLQFPPTSSSWIQNKVRAVVRLPDRPMIRPWHSHLGSGVGSRHPFLGRHLERQPQAVRVDDGQPKEHPRIARTMLSKRISGAGDTSGPRPSRRAGHGREAGGIGERHCAARWTPRVPGRGRGTGPDRRAVGWRRHRNGSAVGGRCRRLGGQRRWWICACQRSAGRTSSR